MHTTGVIWGQRTTGPDKPRKLRAHSGKLSGSSPSPRKSTGDSPILPFGRIEFQRRCTPFRLCSREMNPHAESGRLVAAWSALAERFPEQIGPLIDKPNLVTNGGFERDLLGGGMDWRVVPIEGAVASLDSHGAFAGNRSLRIDFNGKRNLDYGHVFQYVAVQPNTPYRFTCATRLSGITTDSGPRFQVFDIFNMQNLFLSTENRVGTSDWSAQQLEFKTQADTRLLMIRVAHPPST